MAIGYGSHFVRELVSLALEIAKHNAFEIVVESSDRSEAEYLHICREETWFGIRVACHPSVYTCSADYEQIVRLHPRDDRPWHRFITTLEAAVCFGGKVVADPGEVQQAIHAAERWRADGMQIMAEDGQVWQWSAKGNRWHVPISNRPTAVFGGEWLRQARWSGDRMAPSPPELTPRMRISARAECEIRHRLNFRARWVFDVSSEMRAKGHRAPS